MLARPVNALIGLTLVLISAVPTMAMVLWRSFFPAPIPLMDQAMVEVLCLIKPKPDTDKQ